MVFTPSNEIAAKHPVPITTPSRWGYVSLTPNLTPETVSKIIFGPGVNKPTKTKTKSGKKSEILSPQKNLNFHYVSEMKDVIKLSLTDEIVSNPKNI